MAANDFEYWQKRLVDERNLTEGLDAIAQDLQQQFEVNSLESTEPSILMILGKFRKRERRRNITTAKFLIRVR